MKKTNPKSSLHAATPATPAVDNIQDASSPTPLDAAHAAQCQGQDCHAAGHENGQHAKAPHVYVYSPSGAVRDKAAFRRGITRLRAQGYEVEIDADALTSSTRFAGDDATRLAAIGRAAASGADVALIARGGYGLTRLLADMPWKSMAQSVERGMQWVGLSDFTALQLGALAQENMVTWAGPDVLADWGNSAPEGADDIMTDCFDDLVCGRGEGAGWRMRATVRQPLPAPMYIEKATLWGGNLSVLTALLGTPYFPNIQGGVLFLEDVHEHPYRIERMLTQLWHAGVLQAQQAVVLGQFTQFHLSAHDKGFDMRSVVQWLRAHVSVPVVTHLPFGHVPTKVLLPVGASVSLSVEGSDALLYWGHL